MEVLIVFIMFLEFIALISYLIYEYKYYKSEKFADLKNSIQSYINDCNELNEHIKELKETSLNFMQKDYGMAKTTDNSNYNYKRKEFQKYVNSNNIYNCSITVCRNAQQQPFKYLCKYFNVPTNEDTLNALEDTLNKFSAIEQGKIFLKNKKDIIMKDIKSKVPFLISLVNKQKLERKLGFQAFDFSQIHFPTYIFKYISSGGNSSLTTKITLDIENLNRFIIYLSEIIKFRNSIAGQRALMTSELREKIKARDNYSCRYCSNGLSKEPNLLLEIDHIIPLSKGGITSEDNLQTLCWKCNRSKGAKILT